MKGVHTVFHLLTLDTLLNFEYPQDVTLLQVKTLFGGSSIGKKWQAALQEFSPRNLNPLQLKFIDTDNNELPDDLTYDIFLELAKDGQASVIIFNK
jgi:hypothetical protein